MESKSRYYFVLVAGILIGSIVGFVAGALGIWSYVTLTYSSEQIGFFYGMGNLLIGVGIIGACGGSIISGFAFHRLSMSRFHRYAHYIAAILLVVVILTVALGIFSTSR